LKDKKLPAMQWYPGDWRKDIAVQSLSFHDRGVWFEMLMIMHDSEQRGKLMLNGRAMADEQIARAVGLDNQTFNQTLTTLLGSGVAERDTETGAIANRRMVRDEHIRQIRTEAGSKGGNPVLLNQVPNHQPKQKSTPSSSSSTSVVKEKPSVSLAPSLPAEELAGTLPLLNGTEFPISKAQIAEWSQAYPGIHVRNELVRMKVWLDANPERRKTPKGIKRAIIRWLSRAQDQTPIGQPRNGAPNVRTNSNFAVLQADLSTGRNQSGPDDSGNDAGGEAGQGNPFALLRAAGS
jgi:hypothetical protein